MAWGLWNKVKKGFKNVWNGVKKAATWVNDKIIKPLRPAITAAANAVLPGAGTAIGVASNVIDYANNRDWGGAVNTVRNAVPKEKLSNVIDKVLPTVNKVLPTVTKGEVRDTIRNGLNFVQRRVA